MTEILIVIAIIAILAAIIFPAFNSVRENARQSTSIGNMHDISAKLEQYRLDHHRYPDVLFGYVYRAEGKPDGAVISMAKALSQAQADGADVSTYFPGLYPEYIANVNEFTDPNNDKNITGSTDGATPATNNDVIRVNTNVLCPSADAACTGVTDPNLVQSAEGAEFYKADAYDISPRVVGRRELDYESYAVRYSPNWTSITQDAATPPALIQQFPDPNNPGSYLAADAAAAYRRQMRWRNPPAETYITSTTYHVPNAGVVLVLWKNGSVSKLNVPQFVRHGSGALNDGTTGSDFDPSVGVAADANGISQAHFWELHADEK